MSWQTEVDQALAQVASADPAVRQSGATALVELTGDPEAEGKLHDHFARLVADPQPELRAAACAGLRLGGTHPDVVALIEPLLLDSAPPVRREAAFTLASLESASVAPLLRRALGDADEQVRFEAAVGLAAVHDAAGVDVLLAGVDDSVRRFSALGALAQLAEPRGRGPAERVMGKFFVSSFERTQAAGLLAVLGVPVGREHLLAQLAKPRADDRGLAMELCGAHRILAAIPTLRESLHDRQDPWRGTAARSLGLLGEDPSGATLDTMASDTTEELDIRCDAMEGLMFLGTTGARSALERLSASGDTDEVKAAANDALAWLASNAPKGGGS